MIGGLQGEFGDLDIKYRKKNISKCRSHISGSFRRTPRHCAKWLRNSLGKRYQRIRICLTGEVETPSFPIQRQAPDVKYPEKVERRSDRIAAVRYPEKVERWPDLDVRCPGGMSENSPSGWNELCHTSQGRWSARPREREPHGNFWGRSHNAPFYIACLSQSENAG